MSMLLAPSKEVDRVEAAKDGAANEAEAPQSAEPQESAATPECGRRGAGVG